jgi:hypothetical protein
MCGAARRAVIASTLAMVALCPLARADQLFSKIEAAPRSEFWLDTGFATYHLQQDKDLNGRNPGVGAEYRFSSTAAVTAGHFYNSDRKHSSYAGVIYQPFAIGPVRLGAVLGGFNGYPKMRDGGWFPALIPVATIEYKRIGVNLGFIPTYKDRLYGGISVQLKLKLFGADE